MPRLRRKRRIARIPRFNQFAPIGPIMPEEIILTIGEFEAIRLKDLNGLEQEKAAKEMNISQPTFHRLISGARKKIADALVNNKIINIKGGNYEMVQPIISMQGRGQGAGRGMGRGRMGGFGAGPSGFCVCPKCGYREAKVPGVPCSNKKCPKCGTLMVRE